MISRRLERAAQLATGTRQLALGRPGCDVEQLGDLLVGVALDVMEDEDLAVPGRKGGDDPLEVDPIDGLSEARCREWVERAKLNPAATDGTVDILLKLYEAFVGADADLVEINPLILTPDGRVHALDAKVTLDDSADFRLVLEVCTRRLDDNREANVLRRGRDLVR